jgi:tRNA pseudouridine38-40 synthase
MSPPRKIALCVAYHGGGFHGFQRQPGFATVQEELERAWTAVTGEEVVVHGSGRTDSGVHAWGQVVHLSTFARLPVEKVRPALNSFLPEEAVVRAAAEVPADFHARSSARGKRYLYRLAVQPFRPVLQAGQVAWERRKQPLDAGAMQAAARGLLGTHDFAAFAAAGRTTATTVRTVRAIRVWPCRGGVSFLFQGDGFLYRMVRNLVGTLLEVGRGQRAPEWPAAVLDSRDRRRAGATAPAEGLCLWRVLYPEDPFAGLSPGSAGAYPGGSSLAIPPANEAPGSPDRGDSQPESPR